jgi:hypothetical protein
VQQFFTLYSYSKALEYPLEYLTAGTNPLVRAQDVTGGNSGRHLGLPVVKRHVTDGFASSQSPVKEYFYNIFGSFKY